jgi:hypothetical protein
MPLGISESSIKAAYGPMDLSGIYKGLQRNIDKLNKEDQLYRQQNEKEYMQASSKLNEVSKGARSEDMPEILSHINEWKTYTKLRDANPRLIQSDPKKWQEYQSKIDESFGLATNLAKESNEFKTEYKNFGQEITNNAHRYKADAMDSWDNANKMSLSQIKKQGLDNRNTYLSLTPEIDKFYDAFDKGATVKGETFGDVQKRMTPLGEEKKQIKYRNIPEYGTYIDIADNTFSKIGKDQRGRQNYAYSILEDANDYDRQIKQFQQNIKSANPDMLKVMHVSKDMSPSLYLTKNYIDEIKDGKNPQTVASQYLAMKRFNEHFRGASAEDQGFKIGDEIEKMQISSNLSERRADANFNRRAKALGLTDKAGNFDVSGVFSTVAKGGEAGQAQISKLVDHLNSEPLLGVNTTMIGYNLEKNKEGKYEKRVFSGEQDKYGNYKNSSKALESLAQEKEKWSDLSEDVLAKRMNNANKTNAGLISVNVSPKSIQSGKVMSFNWIEKGIPKQVFLDTQDPEAVKWLNKTIKGKIETKKQRVAGAMGLTQDVENEDNYNAQVR